MKPIRILFLAILFFTFQFQLMEAKPKVIFNMATMPQRIASLEVTVASILPQADELNIYLNEFDEVPQFLFHPKINLFKSQEHLGDLGDVGKFLNIAQKRNCYFFTVDDKFIYAPDYADYMIRKIEEHGRKAVISLHGRIFNDRKCTSYYRDVKHFYGCLQHRPTNEWVHEIGTGVMAFYNAENYPDLSIFKRKNMTDIYFSVWCQQNKVPMLVAKHPKETITIVLKHDDRYSIHAQCGPNDQVQTDEVNKINWQILKA